MNVIYRSATDYVIIYDCFVVYLLVFRILRMVLRMVMIWSFQGLGRGGKNSFRRQHQRGLLLFGLHHKSSIEILEIAVTIYGRTSIGVVVKNVKKLLLLLLSVRSFIGRYRVCYTRTTLTFILCVYIYITHYIYNARSL